MLHLSPLLETMIAREGKEVIALTNGVGIEVHTASFRAVRGYTICCAILDEIAFWHDETSPLDAWDGLLDQEASTNELLAGTRVKRFDPQRREEDLLLERGQVHRHPHLSVPHATLRCLKWKSAGFLSGCIRLLS